MGRLFETIDDDLRAWIENQKVFFVATAPLAANGHVNCSPKGLDSFRVLGERQVGYADLTGSGIETVSHVRENGRIVLMFCAFNGPPRIVRLHGIGEIIEASRQEFPELVSHFGSDAGVRAIVKIQVERISDSCGFGVPLYEFVSERETLVRSIEKKGPDGVTRYQREKNTLSIDGLPGLRFDET